MTRKLTETERKELWIRIVRWLKTPVGAVDYERTLRANIGRVEEHIESLLAPEWRSIASHGGPTTGIVVFRGPVSENGAPRVRLGERPWPDETHFLRLPDSLPDPPKETP